jgi:hypothetical protein
MDANIERKLQDAEAALLHNNAAAIRGRERSSQYFLFRATAESFIRGAEVLSDFI